MYDTGQRIALVKRRAALLRRKREDRMLAMLYVACAALCFSLTKLTGLLEGSVRAGVPGLFGSTMLFEGAGGYVLAGVLAFTAGVVVTVLCLRRRDRGENSKPQEKDDGK